jgi:endogenous inhibitor of DNA gyrase (YacG/DUF329 family)
MKRCALCGGKFGLIRHRWHSRQFCSVRCRETFLNQIAKDRDKVHLRTPYESNDPAIRQSKTYQAPNAGGLN